MRKKNVLIICIDPGHQRSGDSAQEPNGTSSSNPYVAHLVTASFQAQMVQGIANGIDQYFAQ